MSREPETDGQTVPPQTCHPGERCRRCREYLSSRQRANLRTLVGGEAYCNPCDRWHVPGVHVHSWVKS